ncbi:MAG: SAM-dependent methyltransferase [Candidatus Nealsonbacteria bacterium CG_4_10_14_0_2_um_filter_38_17]|uniref:SAM-dependent methyltransferase n=2 Tax=Candidatus Nealsoniibacteriota TaxID=1817911 RepID=A0A2M7UXM8_9BACT|nr:MAG: SAM-dependent methyltransferase [Candidatus Nealsonbacteria bacterium CG23_combo_of_CG06-09_8_20_14_all_38_19]PIZ88668.1 MAG: SAM-dependent methyltransferase [Candidatus Nealsonbacteria bacterium CG_4_10_14_0_2_um_filter_38_17]
MKQKKQTKKIDAYEKQAEYYDVIYAAKGKNYKREAEKIHTVIKKYKQSTGNSLLDVGCGTGGHFAFLKKWYQIEGLDIDEHMLAVAKKRFPKILFHHGDMSKFNLDKKFDSVTCLFSAIGYMRTARNMQKAIKKMSRHLKPGGVLVVEPWFSPAQWKVGKPATIFIDKPGLKIARVNISDRRGDISVVNFHFLVATQGKVEHFTELHELGLFTPKEYMNAFKLAGLKVIYDKKGITGRGLYIGVKSKKYPTEPR